MRDPRWIGVTLATFIRLIGAARFTRAALLSLGMLSLCATLVLWEAESDPLASFSMATLSEVRLMAAVDLSRPVEKEAPALAPTAAPDQENVPARPLPKLDKEQSNLALFIARRYQVAHENTQFFVDAAYKAAREYKLDPWLVLAVAAVESSFNPEATSGKGAHGLMQVLTRVHAEKYAPFGGVAAAFDPIANFKVGARILRDYIVRDGSIEGALKSYVGAAFLDDDRGYGYKVLAERERLAAAAAGKPIPEIPPRPVAPQGGNGEAAVESTSTMAAADAVAVALGGTAVPQAVDSSASHSDVAAAIHRAADAAGGEPRTAAGVSAAGHHGVAAAASPDPRHGPDQ